MRLAIVMICALGFSASSAWARGHSHGMSPRGGGGFRAVAAYEAALNASIRREQAAQVMRTAKTNVQRMKYAAKYRQEGNMRLAAMLYERVALTKPRDKNHDAAKKALGDMAEEGRRNMKAADQLLAEGKVTEAFEKLDEMKLNYENVPRFNHEIAEHVDKLHADKRYKAVLNEPQAAKLLAEGRKHEQDNEACCAYLNYEQAAELLPAASAKQAAERLAAMKKDPEIVASAEECRSIQKCCHTFHKAELLKKSVPNRAEELFKQILTEAPRDSEVYRCAAEEVAKLHTRKRS